MVPQLVALMTLLRKEVVRFMRIWTQTLLPPAISMTLYLVIFGELIGSRVGNLGAWSYMDYIVPGIIMMSVITNSYVNVSSSFFSAKFQKHIEELLVSPIPAQFIVLGYVGGGVLRGLMTGLIVTIVAMQFSDLQFHNIPLIIAIVFLTSLLFSLGGLINGLFAKKFDDVSIIPTFVLTPLTYLGGVFYSIDQLPEFWRNLSLFNPILYMVNTFRYGFLGASDIDPSTAFTVILLVTVGMFAATVHLIRKGTGIRD